jgi:gliding motility-associated-like protein
MKKILFLLIMIFRFLMLFKTVRCFFGVIVFLCLIINADAQGTFEKKYPLFQNYVIQTPDLGFISAGTNNNKLVLLKTDLNGNMIWAKEYSNGTKDEANNVKTCSDKGYITTGYTQTDESNCDVLLIKTSDKGDVQWAKSYGDKSKYDVGQCVEPTSDGGFIVGANTGMGQKQIYMIKTDKSGLITWAKTYKFTDSDFCYSVKETADGGFVVCGVSNLSFSYYSRGYLLIFKLDKAGNVLWKKMFKGKDKEGKDLKGTLRDILIKSNSDIIGAGYIVDQDCKNMQGMIIKLNSAGALLNGRTYDNHQCRNAGLNSVDNTSDGGFIAVGGGYTPGFCMSLNVFKITDNLDLDWGLCYKNLVMSNSGNWNQVIKSTKDGGYIISGRTLLKLNSSGRISCSSPFALSSSKPVIAEVLSTSSKEKTAIINYSYYTTLTLMVKKAELVKNTICEDTCTKCESKFGLMVSDSVICKGKPVNFSAISNSTDSTIKWMWKFQGATPSTSCVQNPQNIKFTSTGNFYVSLQITASKGFDTTIVRSFKVGGVDMNIRDFSLCGKKDTMIDAGNPGATFHWGTGERSQRIKIKAPGKYTLTVTSEGCSVSDTITVFSGKMPEVNLPDYTIICNGTDISLNAAGGAYKYLWSTGETQTTIFVYKPGKYSVTATNDCGSFRDSTFVIIADTCNSGYYIPNSFTPNGDGIEDLFIVRVQDFTEFKMNIFNTLGSQIYTNNDPYKYWDGKVDGRPAAEGTYYYVIYLKDQKGRVREFHGSMMLTR